MERSSSSLMIRRIFKEHGGSGAAEDGRDVRVKDSSEMISDDLLGGFPWPPRSYNCTFCKREFRSAQALGGHMNVHRRDRARLRQSSPPIISDHNHPLVFSTNTFLSLNLDPTPNPNPNPNFSSSSCNSSHYPPSPPAMLPPSAASKLPPLISPSSRGEYSCPTEFVKWGAALVGATAGPTHQYLCSGTTGSLANMKTQKTLFGVGGFHENEGKFVKGAEIVRLNLEIGLLSDELKVIDDLDLELRLGYS